eukprot:scaffold10053_cov107-Isochrysis_galbana.AAC.2
MLTVRSAGCCCSRKWSCPPAPRPPSYIREWMHRCTAAAIDHTFTAHNTFVPPPPGHTMQP